MRKTFAVISAVTVVFTCAGGLQAEEAPRCSQRMAITDERFSIRSESATIEDMLCALAMKEEMCAMEQVNFEGTAKVRDYATGEEIKMTDAFYVISPTVKTPQGSGIMAFKTREAAEEFAKSDAGARVLDYRGLLHEGLVK